MSWFSYHGGHSGQFCRHASGRLEEVLRAAHARGFTTYGLSEHAPRERASDLYPDEADLTPDDLARAFREYVVEARRQRDLWEGRLEVLVGFETEVLPPEGWARRMLALREEAGGFDFVIGSVHHVRGIPIDERPERTAQAAEAAGGRSALEREYFELVAEVATRLRPEVLGHLDLIRKFDGPEATLARETWPSVRAALEAAREVGALLDVNASPVRRGRGHVYPLPGILAEARRMGVGVTLGDDSHGPADVGVGLDACLAAIGAAGYVEVHQLVRSEDGVRRVAVPIGDVRPRRRGPANGRGST